MCGICRCVKRLLESAVVLAFCTFSLGAEQSPVATGSIKRAYVDQTGHVHIVRNGRDLRIAGEKDQVSGDAPVIASDNETVGWLVEFPNCCTSYPVPTLLVIYRSGKVVQRIGDGMMLYKWRFLDDGRRVAVSSGTVHGMTGIHLTLYDSRTGRRLKTWDGEETDVPPAWGALVAH